jgi:AraC family transcriptional regulator, transcriptional activator of pobA
MDLNNLHSSYLAGKRIDESFGKYRLSCKVGTYCAFGLEQLSNQRHQHNCFELCIILSGKGKYLYGIEEYSLDKGDIIIADPEIPHEIQSKGQGNLLLLYIFIEIRDNHNPILSKSFEDQVVNSFLKSHHIKNSNKQLLSYISFIEEYNSPKKSTHFGTYQALKSLVLESLTSLSNNACSPNDSVIKNVIETSLDYIDMNLHKKILVKDIANYSCTSQRNLEHLFRKHLDKTIIDYINEKKVNLACHYLDMSFNVSDTANLVGVSNSSHFSNLFKKYKGISPKAYQYLNNINSAGMGRRI